jgi:hypothetical protein
MNKAEEKIMPPEDSLRQLINSHVISRLVYIAAKLDIADLLKEGPKNYKELAKHVDANPSALYRVLRTLSSVEIFSEVDTGFFDLTPMAELLQTDNDKSLRALAVILWEPWWRQGWDELLYSRHVAKQHPTQESCTPPSRTAPSIQQNFR